MIFYVFFLQDGGVYVCLVLPSLVIGTVGGGTALATQKECLKMMDCYGTVSHISIRVSSIIVHRVNLDDWQKS